MPPRHRHNWLTTALITILASPTPAAAQRPSPPVAITHVTVLPMDRDRVLSDQTVIIEGAIISQLGTADRVRIPRGATTIDGSGKYLIPGLADLHVHLAQAPLDQQRDLLKLFALNGVTTVVNLRGTPQMLELRAAVRAGTVFGPTIYTVGPYVNEPFFTTPDEVERAVADQKRAGYDFVKLHGNLSREAYIRLNEVGRREGIRIIGHAPRNLGLDIMFEQHQYALAHAEEFLYDTQNRSTDSSLPSVETRIPEYARSTAQARIWVMPNLTAYKTIARMVHDLGAVLARPEMRYLPAPVRTGWGPATNPYTNRMAPDRYEPMMARYRLLEKMVREFDARGVRLLLGTDAMNTGVVPGTSAHDELADLVTAGLTPYQALHAATANAAEFLGPSDQHGTIAVGQTADLVLLDANPLETIANSRRIAGVMLRGQWLSRADLDRMLNELGS